jgi:hypothetical protein
MRAVIVTLVLNEASKQEDKYIVLVDEKPFTVESKVVEYAMPPDYPQQSDLEIVNKLIYKFRGNNIEGIVFKEFNYLDEVETKEEINVEEDNNKDNSGEVL